MGVASGTEAGRLGYHTPAKAQEAAEVLMRGYKGGREEGRRKEGGEEEGRGRERLPPSTTRVVVITTAATTTVPTTVLLLLFSALAWAQLGYVAEQHAAYNSAAFPNQIKPLQGSKSNRRPPGLNTTAELC